MFTGIIEEVGALVAVRRAGMSARVTVHAPRIAEDVEMGDSVAVNGICLTAVAREGVNLGFDAVPETISRTSLKGTRPGERVNLERALAAGQRIGGHFVQGHVDGTGTVKSIQNQDNARILAITIPAELAKYLVPKGSVAVDGISLTVMEANPESFTVSIIPHTWDHTNLKGKHTGDPINIEVDMLAKYVEKLLTKE